MRCSPVSQQQAMLQDAKILQQMSATGMVSQNEKQDTTLVLALLQSSPGINLHVAVVGAVFCHIWCLLQSLHWRRINHMLQSWEDKVYIRLSNGLLNM